MRPWQSSIGLQLENSFSFGIMVFLWYIASETSIFRPHFSGNQSTDA